MPKFNFVSVLTLTWIFTSAALPAFAQTADPSEPQPTALPAIHRLQDMGNKQVYRGARPELSQVSELRQNQNMRINTIINLQGGDPLWAKVLADKGEFAKDIESERVEAKLNDIRTISLPLNSTAPISDAEAEEIQYALQVMADPKYQPVYLHCSHGEDRAGLVAALYRVQYQNWTPQAAYQEFQDMGHKGLKAQVDCHLDEYFFKVTNWRPEHSMNCPDSQVSTGDL